MSIKNRVKSLFRREEVKGPLVTELEERLNERDCLLHASPFYQEEFSSITEDEAAVAIKFLDRLERWWGGAVPYYDYIEKRSEEFKNASSYRDDIYCYEDGNGLTRVSIPKHITPFFGGTDLVPTLDIPKRSILSVSLCDRTGINPYSAFKSIETWRILDDDQELVELLELDKTELEVLSKTKLLITIPWHRDLDLMASRLNIWDKIIIHTVNDGLQYDIFCIPEVVPEVLDKLNEVSGLYGREEMT